jgi:hypothetical protein
MNFWPVALALATCALLAACSQRDGLFSLSPVFTAQSGLPASEIADCVQARWKQGARSLDRGEIGNAITLRGGSFFTGAAIGVKVVPDGSHTRVEYFERRYTDPLYWTMVRGCMNPNVAASNETP